MNFNDLIKETYVYIDETQSPSYDKIIKSALNFAYRKVAKEKFNLDVEELTNLTDEPVLDKYVDGKIYCFYASYMFFTIDGDDEGKGNRFIDMFNTELGYIEPRRLEGSVYEEEYVRRVSDTITLEDTEFPV